MSEAMERAHEIHGHHEPEHTDSSARRIAVLISILAAALALVQIAEKSSQNAYLTHHVAVSDDWAFYQAKNVRAVVYDGEASVLASLPNAADPAVQARIQSAHASEARMRDDPEGGDGMKQLAERAHLQEHQREDAFHQYHGFELVSGGLEIAIVLASVAVVTRVNALAFGAGMIGAIAVAGGLAVAGHLV